MTGVRRAQLITPFGVGALLDVGEEAFTCADISVWRDEDTFELAPSQLGARLGRPIRTPRSEVPFFRFPRWLFCPSCRRMTQQTHAAEAARIASGFQGPPRCPNCRVRLAPMGFVQACENGHLGDIEWHSWAHRAHQPATQGQCNRAQARLRFITSGASGGDWNSLIVKCDACGSANTLLGLTDRPLHWPCAGHQPWEGGARQPCDRTPYGFRRGNSNLYYPRVLSAIDLAIAVRSMVPDRAVEHLLQQVSSGLGSMEMIRVYCDVQGVERTIKMLGPKLSDFAARHDVPLEGVVEALAQVLTAPSAEADGAVSWSAAGEVDQQGILAEEWPVLSRQTPVQTEKLVLVPRVVRGLWPPVLTELVDQVTLIPRLREVRALTGFRRVSDTAETLVPVDLSRAKNWLPGVEVWGEGIFIKLSEAAVAAWEGAVGGSLGERFQALTRRANAAGRQSALLATPRFILLHTMSHVLMRRLAFDAGYSSTSLRERIFASGTGTHMAGILIYTADGDSEGSLGGLVRLGEPSRLLPTLLGAFRDAGWCSADPICAETGSQGLYGLNGAACHACALVAETSCTYSNTFLDRRLMLNLDGAAGANGFLGGMMDRVDA